jgi:hypothetical protein
MRRAPDSWCGLHSIQRVSSDRKSGLDRDRRAPEATREVSPTGRICRKPRKRVRTRIFRASSDDREIAQCTGRLANDAVGHGAIHPNHRVVTIAGEISRRERYSGAKSNSIAQRHRDENEAIDRATVVGVDPDRPAIVSKGRHGTRAIETSVAANDQRIGDRRSQEAG